MKRLGFGFWIAAVVLILDQLTKFVVVEKVMRPEGVTETPFFSRVVVPVLPVFDLSLTWNTGISFSLFNSGTTTSWAILLTVQIVISLVLIWMMAVNHGRLFQVACGLIVGGALGNIVDRALYRAVADFLHFYWGDWHFPTFNLADAAISVGVALWLLDAVRGSSHHVAKQEPSK